MKVLVDTHALLWYLMADPRLSGAARNMLADVRNQLFLSMASLWEIGIKSSIGKLTLPGPFAAVFPKCLADSAIDLLPIKLEHVAVASGCRSITKIRLTAWLSLNARSRTFLY